MDFGLHEHPENNLSWRRHPRGCPHYRERWFHESNTAAGEPMYQVFCLHNTPPETQDEQELCLASKTKCWRLSTSKRKRPRSTGASLDEEPERQPA